MSSRERLLERMRRKYVLSLDPEYRASRKRVSAAVEAIQTKYGKGSISPVLRSADLSVPCVKSRWQELDDVLTGAMEKNRNGKPVTIAGSGRGWPRGRVIEVAGKESGGKTTVCLETVAAFQEAGCTCAYLDAEHTLDLEYAERIGVDLDDWLLSQPDSAEQALNMVTELVRGGVDLIVVDSVAALAPMDEQEKDSGEVTVALLPRLLSTELRKMTALLGPTKSLSTVIFVNQEREVIGAYGNQKRTKTPGGKALKFYASIRVDIRSVGQIKKGEDVIGQRCCVKIIKNKVATPFRKVFLDMTGGDGVTEVHTKMKR